MWECVWKKALKSRPGLNDQVQRIHDLMPHFQPLEPREALYGGRVGVSSVMFPCKGDLFVSSGEKVTVRGKDVISLYPWVMKYCNYPIGHPQVIFGFGAVFDFNPHAYFGLIACTVLPPRKLFFPVLPYRVQ